jgi:hypothetical protein
MKKVRHVTEQRYRGDNCWNRQPERYHHPNFKWQDHGNSNRPDTYDKRNKKQDDKIPAERDNKAFKPCSVHGPKSKHTFEECHNNPRNAKHQPYDRKHLHEAHHNDARYTSEDDESRSSTDDQPQVRIRHPLQVGAKNTKMRTTIFKLPKE